MDGESDGLVVEFNGWLYFAVVVGIGVVDFVQRDPLVVAIKTLPVEVCFLNPMPGLDLPPELLERLD
jgi:hypothetical protein